MDLHNNPNLGTDLLAVKVKQLEDKIKQLTQIVGNVEGTIENLSNRVETANLEVDNAEIKNLSVTETLQTNAMVLGKSLEVGSATIGEVSATSVSSEEIDSAVSHIGEADGKSLDLTGDIHSASIKLDNLVNDVLINTTRYVGYNNSGKLIPVDPTKGIAKWENTARANAIRPTDNANVEIHTDLTLSGLESEAMSDTVVLGVDESGTVVKKDASETLQKKLTAGYNIRIIDNVISCDITTMQMKGSVETVEDLPTTGNVLGDVWNVITNNQNYCWNGSSWFIIGSSVDLTNYYTKLQTDSKVSSEIMSAVLNVVYPVGSIKISENNINPGTYITGTTWILKSSGRVLQGADDDHAGGTEIEAGLPNIIAKLGAPLNDGGDGNQEIYGAFQGSYKAGNSDGNRGDTRQQNGVHNFSAKNGEAGKDGYLKPETEHHVYGASDTVQPPAYVVYIWKRTA